MPPKAKKKAIVSRAKTGLSAPSNSGVQDPDETAARLKSQFTELDSDGDGTLSFDEMKHLFNNLNSAMTDEQLHTMYDSIDINGDGNVSIDEFINWLCGVQPSSQGGKTPKGRKSSQKVIRENKASDVEVMKWSTDIHTRLRDLHGVNRVLYSKDCGDSAQKQANACHTKGKLFHGSTSGKLGEHGQNIFFSEEPVDNRCGIERVIKSWYDQIEHYDYSTHEGSDASAYFSQTVWSASEKFGIAFSEDGRYCVCNYYPRGNQKGKYGTHVLPVLKEE